VKYFRNNIIKVQIVGYIYTNKSNPRIPINFVTFTPIVPSHLRLGLRIRP